MSKMRVYEYAKEKNVQSKDVINKLKSMNVEVTNHMSTITDDTKTKLDQMYNGGSNKQGNEGNNNNQQRNSQNTNKSNQNQSQQNNRNNQSQSNDKSRNNNNKPNNSQNRNQNKNQNKNQNRNQNNNRNKNKGNQKSNNRRPAKTQTHTPDKITYAGSLAVSELASKLHKDSSEIIKKLMFMGVMATKNQDLDPETIELICDEFGVEVEEEIIVDETDFENYITDDNPEDLVERPSVVTIMGHVDHGKTTLLDSIRKTKVTAGEAGGITQHIGAYQVEEDGKKITFLDTPGHAAFTSMRSRGAQVTDIAILVVAADDGVMPQTIEAINHAKAAEVPIIVAVNKMDKEGANPDRVKQELMEYNLVPEEFGGETIFVHLSAVKDEGLDNLLEMIVLVSEVEELKANPNRLAMGTVIEAELDKGRGSVATLLVQNGTLNVGDAIVVGNTFGRIRAMVNDLGKRVKTAPPSTPVEITGLNGVPNAGDRFVVFQDEKKARQVGELRQQRQIEENRGEKSKVNLDDLFEHIKQGEMKDLNIIIKADVQGSAEALASSLQQINVEGVNVKIIHTGVGAITESDIILASASNAIVIGFNVRPDANAKKTAETEDVDVRPHRIIYKVIEEIEFAMKGLLDPEYQEKIIGQAEVREIFKVSKIGTIAGSYVTEGKLSRNAGIRVIRDGIVQFEGEVDTLKRYKDDAKEVDKGYECGVTIKNFNDLKEGDTLEAFIMEEIKPQ
ncbi:translation initiation factor IF-2 [Pontibacillus yanchengensis]|uniref:Translation initiation factor IF-2 n=2 Tax=Pontibacillus yanchengensis TaxID=462910 RepID=A0ACC7VBE9_9BACI|nr:translation initiation factor IF-2 [Pontibacillus yanchengensis]MYL33185.1 translation initiation factor IF-2 [Pontibacillus yanchengensis]MYL51965.1 translation initiation factor IF-2 [Pontibacillus yanchengensis]